MKSTHVEVKPFFSKKLKQKTNGVIISEKLIQLVSSLVEFKKKKVMDRKKIYDENYEDIIRSIQEYEDDISVSGMTVSMIIL